MALLFMDGFDHYGNGTDLVASGKWGSTTAVNAMSASTSQARTGAGSALAPTTSFSAVTKSLPVSGGFVVGFGLRLTGTLVTVDLLQIREGTTVHLAVTAVSGTGVLQVRNGSGTVLGTGTTVLVANSWYYLEFKGTIHDTTGSFELRIDGVTEPNCSLTGVDTRNGATGAWDRVGIVGVSGSNTYFDDFYVCDTSGSAPRNTFLGPIKIDTLLPQTDAVAAGSNAGLTPSTGTDHGALVDEVGPNTTDYNGSATVGAKDTYNYPSMTLTGAILGIQTNLYVQKSDALPRQVCAVVRAGGTDYDGANVSPVTSFSYQCELRPQNPNTSADWISTDVAALQAGMKVTV